MLQDKKTITNKHPNKHTDGLKDTKGEQLYSIFNSLNIKQTLKDTASLDQANY